MSAVLGSAEFRYEVVTNWEKLPDGWAYRDVVGVAVDSRDQVYVFNRGLHPVIVYDRDGNFLRSWGEEKFWRAHGIDIGPDDSVYCTDDHAQTIRKFSSEGKLLLTIGTAGERSPYMSGLPFHMCTHTALSPQGDIYVSDGYGNARVHKYSPDGKLQFSWGEPGTDPGQFNIVHNICCDDEGWVFVADRENHRIQVFDKNGKYETQWNNLHRPCGLFMQRGPQPLCFVGELGPQMDVNKNVPNLGPRISICSYSGKVIGRLGTRSSGFDADQFIAPHGIALDSRGDIYLGEVSNTFLGMQGALIQDPREVPCLRKLVKIE